MIIEHLIAHGGFGRVERVRLLDGRTVAKKTFSPIPDIVAETSIDKLKARFAREVQVQSQLNQRSVMPVISADLTNAEPYYLMPLADKNFQEEINSNSSFLQSGLADILNALDDIHRLGYVHRDLKPQNILLHEGTWKLTDFGLVLPPNSDTPRLTSIYSAWGTKEYCAPEQQTEFSNVTYAVDIYAFGCILHDIFEKTRRIPFQRYTGRGEIGTIIEKCTEINPERRFRNISALRTALLTVLNNDTGIITSNTASQWIDAIQNISTWDEDKVRALTNFIQQSINNDDIPAIFESFDEDVIHSIYAIDDVLWKVIALKYCEWIFNSSFSFDYCDVLISRLEVIFSIGDIECKAYVAIAVARLGEYHNRWRVMERLLFLCGHTLEDAVAHRIAIEIYATDSIYNFRRCAEGISRTNEAYHPKIAACLVI